MFVPWLLISGVVAIIACGGGTHIPNSPPATHADTESASNVATVAESWISAADTNWDLDTPALWFDGDTGIVMATGKGSHKLHLFDPTTGASLGTLGVQGSGMGEFSRPNAVLTIGNHALVIERDNHRVQLLSMPDGKPVGSFGSAELVKPYGGVVMGAADSFMIFITDDYDQPVGIAPDYSRRVHRFEVSVEPRSNPSVSVSSHVSFGDSDGDGALSVVETIGLDLVNDRLMIADEATRRYLSYSTTGQFQGETMGEGLIKGDPEGMALIECPDGAGYWLATDQQPKVSWFRIFDRKTLDPIGSFRGRVTANTDGVSFVPGPVPGFPGGLLLAVHDDQAVAAFDWIRVTAGLGLRSDCGLR